MTSNQGIRVCVCAVRIPVPVRSYLDSYMLYLPKPLVTKAGKIVYLYNKLGMLNLIEVKAPSNVFAFV